MDKIRLHARAKNDLIDIWRYGFEKWDEVQADEYLEELSSAMQSLLANPHLGVRRDVVRAGYRALFANHHAIYYKVEGVTIDIVRVLHSQMDPEKHLEPSDDDM